MSRESMDGIATLDSSHYKKIELQIAATKLPKKNYLHKDTIVIDMHFNVILNSRNNSRALQI